MLIPKRFFIYAIAGFALPLVGCGLFAPEESLEPPGEPNIEELPPISPENVLNNLVFSYVNRNYDAYQRVLGTPFEFHPSDQDGEIGLFDRDQDLASTENMFDSVDNITMRLTFASDVPSDRQQYPADQGYRMILVTRVELSVQTRDIIGGEPLILQVGGDPATFIFRPDTTTSPVEYRLAYQKDDS